MKKPTRFRLLAFLIAVCAVGGAIGYVARQPRYRHVDGGADGFFVRAMWQQRVGHESEFQHLIAYPDGDMHGGGATEWPLNSTGSSGVSSHPFGVYVQGTKAVPRNGYGIWVYLPIAPKGDVRFVEIPPEYQLNLGVGDFSTLEDSEMWRKFIRPVLVEESLNWRDYYEKKISDETKINYEMHSSRFPRRSQIDWDNLEKYFPRKK